MADERTAQAGRDEETRETEDRLTEYRPPANLPDPTPEDGFVFRWIRVSALGDADNRNVSMRFREGWDACLAEDHANLMIMSDVHSTYDGNIVIGGLMLCKCSVEKMAARDKYYQQKAAQQAASVDQNFMRESDPRMPVLQTEHTSQTTFGVGRRR
jgi:hypothetical protein